MINECRAVNINHNQSRFSSYYTYLKEQIGDQRIHGKYVPIATEITGLTLVAGGIMCLTVWPIVNIVETFIKTKSASNDCMSLFFRAVFSPTFAFQAIGYGLYTLFIPTNVVMGVVCIAYGLYDLLIFTALAVGGIVACYWAIPHRTETKHA